MKRRSTRSAKKEMDEKRIMDYYEEGCFCRSGLHKGLFRICLCSMSDTDVGEQKGQVGVFRRLDTR